MDSRRKTRNATTIQVWLITQISKSLGIDPQDIDVRDSFASYGLDSATAVRLVGELEDWLDLQLSPILTWEYPTIRGLAWYLAGELDCLGQTVDAQTHDRKV